MPCMKVLRCTCLTQLLAEKRVEEWLPRSATAMLTSDPYDSCISVPTRQIDDALMNNVWNNDQVPHKHIPFLLPMNVLEGTQ